ncbi:uncharacterized protein SPSK_10650 [Sporothrix schenckii 1099-18]|uniref:Uncharacterized protein n=1 Tax=Sporothrix schenckii 1099-18 TaxID=1397361 RepID=A0A0F2LTS6_SPOSC|nr:uncharacterized protein SPSK_10650 [Sporothrix schenckii 1099-18]KJR80882.1 hypothetical protein SPSK_10650 [Sporothrix schenckii 1099-18]
MNSVQGKNVLQTGLGRRIVRDGHNISLHVGDASLDSWTLLGLQNTASCSTTFAYFGMTHGFYSLTRDCFSLWLFITRRYRLDEVIIRAVQQASTHDTSCLRLPCTSFAQSFSFYLPCPPPAPWLDHLSNVQPCFTHPLSKAHRGKADMFLFRHVSAILSKEYAYCCRSSTVELRQCIFRTRILSSPPAEHKIGATGVRAARWAENGSWAGTGQIKGSFDEIGGPKHTVQRHENQGNSPRKWRDNGRGEVSL